MAAPLGRTPTPMDILSAPAGRGQSARAVPSGNTPLAEEMAVEVRRIVRQAASQAPRSRQRRLGPSEIGHLCDRNVVGKLVGADAVNTLTDPWPSVVGTAVHAWLADAFELDNTMRAQATALEASVYTDMPDDVSDAVGAAMAVRSEVLPTGVDKVWTTEHRVTPLPESLGGHPGTADLYDALRKAVWDHKCLGETSMNKVRRGTPPHGYVVQLGLYGLGYMRAGRPVERVGIFAYPRTGSTLDGIYVWETPFDAKMARTLLTAISALARRKEMAQAILDRRMPITQVPITPSDDCYFCPFFSYGRQTDGRGCSGRGF
jgi:hypothetical protein